MTAKLKLIPADPTLDEIREQSAKAGKHLSDGARLTILSRDWSAVHVAGDRGKAVRLSEMIKRVWR